jgi:hypothetical protein
MLWKINSSFFGFTRSYLSITNLKLSRIIFVLPKFRNEFSEFLGWFEFISRLAAGCDSSTVALRVVEGDEKGTRYLGL